MSDFFEGQGIEGQYMYDAMLRKVGTTPFYRKKQKPTHLVFRFFDSIPAVQRGREASIVTAWTHSISVVLVYYSPSDVSNCYHTLSSSR